ncbi:Hypothetical predicted protein [Mytilus galloprovincialis]|uniref:Uncharacterized protein n=1 Tax=Mytilus galloprovincialis TaxID=29158 RepID=A0A8B6FFB7_MYTGA|nr:Hypothetical predicted protein [Mytilus galloprovincialis]
MPWKYMYNFYICTVFYINSKYVTTNDYPAKNIYVTDIYDTKYTFGTDPGSSGHSVFSEVLRGQPNVRQNRNESSVKKPKSEIRNYGKKVKNAIIKSKEVINEVEFETVKTSEKAPTTSAIFESALKETHIVHTEKEFQRDKHEDKPDVSIINHYTVREHILEEVRKGQYIIEIAPSDLVDFGGQRSYDMTHQLFIQQGSFIIMFNGIYELMKPLPEYPQGDVTSGCK